MFSWCAQIYGNYHVRLKKYEWSMRLKMLMKHTGVLLLFSLNFSSHSLCAFSSASYWPMSCAWCSSALSMSLSLPFWLRWWLEPVASLWLSKLSETWPSIKTSSSWFSEPSLKISCPLSKPLGRPSELEMMPLFWESTMPRPTFNSSTADLVTQTTNTWTSACGKSSALK